MPKEAFYFFLKAAAVVGLFIFLAVSAFSQTPTPGTPEEWSEWLDGRDIAAIKTNIHTIGVYE